MENTSIPEELKKEAYNTIYMLIQAALQELLLMETVGYDLANDMANMPYHLLRDKQKKKFEEFVEKIVDPNTRSKLAIFLLNSSLPVDSEQIASLRRYQALKELQFKDQKEKEDATG